MRKSKPKADFRALAQVQDDVASSIRRVKKTGRPMVITQKGKGTAVLMGFDEYADLIETIEVLRDIRDGERALDAGKGLSMAEVRRRLSQRFGE